MYTYVIYYLNSAEYPRFAFIYADTASQANRIFRKEYPESAAIDIFIKCEDIKGYVQEQLGGLK